MESILFLGDLLCTDDIVELIANNDYEKLIGHDLAKLIFDPANFVVINLEGPITNYKKAQRKGGSPNLKSNPILIEFLEKIPNLIISGANNHITDFGLEGVQDTIHFLKEKNIPYIGFDTIKNGIYRAYEISLQNKVISICSFAQNEFCTMNIAKYGYGATPYDPLNTFDWIQYLKNKTDLVVVLFHGGKENYPYPTPNQTRICHKMIEAGADLVICQHSHCVGCLETYLDKTIIYGTGNFIFNVSNLELWKTALVTRMNISENKINIDFIPINRNNRGVMVSQKEKREEILTGFRKRSEEIRSTEFITACWNKYCVNNQYTLLWNGFFRFPKIVYWIDRLTGRFFSKRILKNWQKNLTTYNYIRCEAINEMCQTIFEGIERSQTENLN